jgi:hypothetical protein
MSLLSDFEDRVGRAVEGVFAGVFRSPVQPAELARAAGREMDKRRRLGVGKVYAPTLYSVLLSPDDAGQLGGFTATLSGELETYLTGYAREKGYELATRPRVQFLVDEELKLGRFEVIGELMSADEIESEVTVGDAHDPAPAPVPEREPVREEHPISTVTVKSLEHDIALTGNRMVIGRLQRCDICLPDVNASREHAALEREGAGWRVVDLGSTNGTTLNGKDLEDPVRLQDGDIIGIGVTEIVFHEPRG